MPKTVTAASSGTQTVSIAAQRIPRSMGEGIPASPARIAAVKNSFPRLSPNAVARNPRVAAAAKTVFISQTRRPARPGALKKKTAPRTAETEPAMAGKNHFRAGSSVP